MNKIVKKFIILKIWGKFKNLFLYINILSIYIDFYMKLNFKIKNMNLKLYLNCICMRMFKLFEIVRF